MADKQLRCARAPCASCPYRRDVPSGVWAREEYEKLPLYDGPTWAQHPHVFMCHQRDGKLCAGWLGCHGAGELLALRVVSFHQPLDVAIYDYKSPVPLWSSGKEAMEHGLQDLEEPGIEARLLVDKLEKRRKGTRR